jgi:alkylation response protein AidB-like acyl-CoA dehydrogenase
MDFNLTEEQKILQKMVKDFTEKIIEPNAVRIDHEGRLPDDLIGQLARIGLLGMTIPANSDDDARTLNCSLAIEQIAYSGTGAWWLVAFNNSIPEIIHLFGSEDLKKKYLIPLCDGSSYGSVQFTEEDTGSDPDALTTKAAPDGEYYVVNGMKRFSTFGARNGYAILYTKDENGACTAFVIQKNQKGYSPEKTWDLMGTGGIEAVDVYLQNLKVPKKDILGTAGKGFDILLHWIAIEKIMQCSANVGMAQAALDEAIKYVKARKSRGKPVSVMQGIRWMLADMKCKLEAARYLTYRAASLYDRKDMNWKAEAACAKLFVVPATLEIIELARQLHGCYGYTRDFKIERLYRSAAGASGIATSLEINRSIVGSWLIA